MNKLVIAVFMLTLVTSSLGAGLIDVVLRAFENQNDGSGNYRYFFDQSDDTRQEQRGTLRNAGTDNAFVDAEGYYTWRAPNGDLYQVNYKADENGYRPKVTNKGPGALPPAATASLLG